MKVLRRPIILSALLLVCVSFSVYAQEGLKEQADQIIGRLQFSPSDLAQFSRGTAAQVRRTFKDALVLMDKIAEEPSLISGDREKLLIRITTQLGKTFDEFTSPYVDPVRYTENRHRFNRAPVGEKLSWIAIEVFRRSEFWLKSFVRDFTTMALPRERGGWRVPPALLFVGRDTRRSTTATGIAKDIRDAFKAEIQQAKKLEVHVSVTPGGQALIQTIDAMSKSEPMRYGMHNHMVWWGYLGVGVALFFHPVVEPFIELTTFSPLISGMLYFFGGTLLSASRTRNSGLKAYLTIRRLLKQPDVWPFLKSAQCKSVTE